MTDPISSLTTRTNLDADAVKRGFGALMNFLKERLPADLYARVEAAVPRAEESISAFLSNQQGSGVLGKIGGLVGDLMGGKAGDLSELFNMLSKAGLSLDQSRDFLPKAIEQLKSILPEDLLQQIMSRLPGLEAATEPAGS